MVQQTHEALDNGKKLPTTPDRGVTGQSPVGRAQADEDQIQEQQDFLYKESATSLIDVARDYRSASDFHVKNEKMVN